MSCGGWHTGAVTEAGQLFTCGRGEYGRLGLGEQSSHLILVQVQALQVRGARPTGLRWAQRLEGVRGFHNGG